MLDGTMKGYGNLGPEGLSSVSSKQVRKCIGRVRVLIVAEDRKVSPQVRNRCKHGNVRGSLKKYLETAVIVS